MDGGLEKWVKRVNQTSSVISSYLLNEELDDSFGWGARMSALAAQLPDDDISGLLLTGPDGCGRHNCISYFIRDLADAFEPVFLSASSFKTRGAGAFETSELVGALLDDFYDRKTGACLIFDGVGDDELAADMLEYLSETVCEYHLMRDEYPPLLVVIIKSDPSGIPALLRSRLLHCGMTCPTEEQRMSFIEAKAKDIKKCVDFKKLTSLTDGFSYSGMLDLIRNVTLELDARDELTIKAAALEALARSQRTKTDDSAQRIGFYNGAEKFMGAIPKILERIASQRVQAAPAYSTPQMVESATKKPDEQNYEKRYTEEREKIESMPVRQLSAELFGEEFVDKMLNTESGLEIEQS